MAALLFAIVLVFFVCHAPKAVINIYEVFENLCSVKSVGSLCFSILLSKVTFTCFFLQVLYELSPRAVNSTTEAIGDEVKRALGRS